MRFVGVLLVLAACGSSGSGQTNVMQPASPQVEGGVVNQENTATPPKLTPTVVSEHGVLDSGDRAEPAGGAEPAGEAEPANLGDKEVYLLFVTQVKGSRGSLEKCYREVYKEVFVKDPSLSVPVVLTVEVSFLTSGTLKTAKFLPQISQAFIQCMEQVAKHWTLPVLNRETSFSFNQTVSIE